MAGPKEHFDVRILGPLEVVSGGSLLTLGGQKQRAVLAILATRANTVVSADELIEQLWGESPPATATTTVQVYISRLRKLLGADLIATTGGGYQLRVEPEQLDAARFERLAAQGRELRIAGQASEAAIVLGEALSLWRGPALADFAYDSWAQSDSARLEEERLACLEERLEADLGCGRDSELVGELEALVAAHPLRERLRAQLMLALYRAGRQAEALDAYQHARSTLVDELGIEPGPELQQLNRRILNQDVTPAPVAATPTRPPGTNLPVQPTPLVGREHELREVLELLAGTRLVTLTGAGGSGKTRLALEAAADLVDDFEDGVWWVSLAALRDPELVEPTIAQVVGAKDRLAQWARAMEALLLLDNCEHLLNAVAGVVSGLAEAADVRVLATSRERLGIAAEQEYPVPTLRPEEARALFVARARRSKPDFEPNGHVAEICQRLDGLPLAVELAAARITALTPDRILERLSRSLDLLTGGARDAPERQRTLRGTIEWSHNLLSAEEQQLFARLAVFPGGCSLEAAEEVAQANLDALQSLVEKSLLRGTGNRYWMLETIRGFAEERLNAMEDVDVVRGSHVEYYVAFADQADAGMKTAEQERWLSRLAEENANLRSAIDWASDHDHTLALRLCASLAWFWTHTDAQEGRRRLASALERSRDAPANLRVWALDGACVVSHACGEFGDEFTYATEQLRLADELGSPAARARALSSLALAVAACEGDLERALTLLRESVDIARTLDEAWMLTVSTLNLGWMALANRDYVFAIESLEESLALSRAQGDRVFRMHILFNLGQAHLKAGDPNRAAAIFEECIRMSKDVGFADGLVYCLVGLAGVALRQGEAERAARLLGAADTGRTELGIGFEPADQQMYDELEARAIEALGADTAAAASRTGRGMRLDEAVDYALSLD